MANDKETSEPAARAAIFATPALPRPLPKDGDGKASPPPVPGPGPAAPEPPPAPVEAPPPPPPGDLLPTIIAERDEARRTAQVLSVRLREVEADGAARRKLATALSRSLQQVREEKEALASRLEAAEAEIARLRAYRHDLEGARLAADRERIRSEAALAAAHRARAEAESLADDLKKDIRSLRQEVAALGRERDEALLHRADAVQAALASIRDTLLEEL